MVYNANLYNQNNDKWAKYIHMQILKIGELDTRWLASAKIAVQLIK